MWELDCEESWVLKNWCLNCGVGEDSWESLGLQGDPTSPSWRRSVLGVHWKDWRWSWNSSTLGTSCEELTHWKRPWCWEGLGAGGEGDSRGWDGWMASPTRWAWVWVNSGSWYGQEAWRAAIHGITKSRTRLSDWVTWSDHDDSYGGFHFVFIFMSLCFLFWFETKIYPRTWKVFKPLDVSFFLWCIFCPNGGFFLFFSHSYCSSDQNLTKLST